MKAPMEQPNVDYLVNVFTTLLELGANSENNRLRILYDVISNKSFIEVLNSIQQWNISIEKPQEWFVRVYKVMCISNLEY
jgi:hypothetical protein